MATEVLDV